MRVPFVNLKKEEEEKKQENWVSLNREGIYIMIMDCWTSQLLYLNE